MINFTQKLLLGIFQRFYLKVSDDLINEHLSVYL